MPFLASGEEAEAKQVGLGQIDPIHLFCFHFLLEWSAFEI